MSLWHSAGRSMPLRTLTIRHERRARDVVLAFAALMMALLGALLLSAPAAAAGFSLTASAFADDANGGSLDLDGTLRPTESWWIGAGVGRSDASQPGADFSGTGWRASTGWQGQHLGLRASTRNWSDSQRFDSQSSSGELSWSFASGFGIGAIVQSRSLDIGYTVTALGRTANASLALEGEGYGAEVLWGNAHWFVSARAVTLDYGASAQRIRAAALSPTTSNFPRLQALVDSVLTRSFAATDRELSLSIDRTFARSGLRLDLSRSRDAVTAEIAEGASFSYRYRLSPRIEVEGTLGVSQSDFADTSGYGGLALTFRN